MDPNCLEGLKISKQKECHVTCQCLPQITPSMVWWTFTSNSANKSFHSVSNYINDSYNSDKDTLECNLDTIGGGGSSKNSHVLSLRHCSWRGTKCDLIDEVWDFAARKWIIVYNPREVVDVKK
jgi:hypothetical protein